ncbi:MBL fold metallo-hydrolase RNA specificity domain-containing protein [Leisingera sp. ANG-S5]|jgi:metallo-beta-lactamase family protein|uniref:MBL fold metallo-hydrolase RNA specificity domain-containing protein n=1 Tax=Leisingera sp. ANG-S5 TaxID=1577901 RepID=UPI00057F2D1F|nr:MBL fold metallo-hydrolase [Leisingera sp. ANG-S5]KIC31495.1 mRNA 3'-end processing factor [Leisingera sp. ANG-S5]
MSKSQQPTLRFLGATGTVTGSRYLVEWRSRRILIDCGLFQGFKQLRLRNRKPFPVRPRSIDTVLLTHAHLDHSGYIPALVKAGFAGKVICTQSTKELCGLILPDSGHLQEEEASFARRKKFSVHARPTPLYTRKDAQKALSKLETVPFDMPVDLGDGITANFIPAGHLLGAAQIRLCLGSTSLHFSGDLGRQSDPLMRSPTPFAGADVLVCESTYGNRLHELVDAEAQLSRVIRRVIGRGGTILIPAFAVGRAQGLMYHIARLRRRGDIPEVPVFLNSPMATNATEIYHRHHSEHKVSWAECLDMFELAKRVRSVEESKQLNTMPFPKIIISASGMLTGGRILHHVLSYGGDRRNAILLSGFQASGTRGAALAAGADHLRIFGRDIPIEAEVISPGSLSGHADANELLEWLGAASVPPRMTYVTHGEPEAADALRFRINHELGWKARVPEHLETIRLETPR